MKLTFPCYACSEDVASIATKRYKASLNIFQKFVLFSYVMALFKAVVWALIFLTSLMLPLKV